MTNGSKGLIYLTLLYFLLHHSQDTDNSLDLTWLIQLQMGQTIEINFLSFDLEYFSKHCAHNCNQPYNEMHQGHS